MPLILKRSKMAATLTLALTAAGFAGTANAVDSFDAGNRQLTIPVVSVGALVFSNMVVTVGGVVSGPSGTAPAANADSYSPATKDLTVPAVAIGSATYYNVVASVTALQSIGGVSGGDSYSGGNLTLASIQVGGTIYTDVVVTVAGIVSAGGGMPLATTDSYDFASGELTMVAVQVGSKVYTNPVVRIGSIVHIGPSHPAAPGADLQAFASVFVALQFTNGLVDLTGITAQSVPCTSGSASLNPTSGVASYLGCIDADLPGNAYGGTLTATNGELAGGGYLQVESGSAATLTATAPVAFSATTTTGGFFQDESLSGTTIDGAFSSASLAFTAGKTSNYTLTSYTISQLTRTPVGGVFTTDVPAVLGGVTFNGNAALETESSAAIVWQESGFPTTGTIFMIAADGTVELTVQFLPAGRISFSDPLTGFSATKNWTDADVQAALAYVTE